MFAGFHVDADDTKHGGLNSEHPEHTYLDMATTFQFHTLLFKSSIFSSSTYRKKCLLTKKNVVAANIVELTGEWPLAVGL